MNPVFVFVMFFAFKVNDAQRGHAAGVTETTDLNLIQLAISVPATEPSAFICSSRHDFRAFY
jgi:hypothetical protein